LSNKVRIVKELLQKSSCVYYIYAIAISVIFWI